MIKISKSLFELHSLADKHYNLLIGPLFNIQAKLDAVLKDHKLKPYERKLFNVFKIRLKEIITKPPKDLILIHNQIFPLYQAYISKKTDGLKGNEKRAAIQRANEKIFSVFDYISFTKKSDGKYAYELTENLDVDVCVYCNRQFTFTLMADDGKCRPTLDHFLDKGKHPYFALSFFNLIPSCYVCNSSLKNQQHFSLTQNLHPFFESMYDVLEFTIDITSVDFINGVKEDYSLELKPSKNCSDSQLISRASANAKLFQIEKLYQGHKDYVSDILKKAYYYNKSRIDELYNTVTDKGERLFESKIEVIEFALGNYITEKKLGRRVLSKLTSDLVRDLRMLKNL